MLSLNVHGRGPHGVDVAVAMALLMQLLDDQGKQRLEAKLGMNLQVASRGLGVPQEAQERITRCTDTATLERWAVRALTAHSISDVLAD